MTEFWSLLLVVLVLYLAEAAVWVPAGSVAFRLPVHSGRPMRMITKLRSVPRSGIVFALPFCPRGEVVVCSPLPVSLSPEGIAHLAGLTGSLADGEFIAFEHMAQVNSEQRELFVNGAPFVRAGSDLQAAELAHFLNRIRKLTPKARGFEIEKELARRLDPECISSRLKEYVEQTFGLNLDSLVLLVGIFMVSPILVWRWGLVSVWPLLLAYLLLSASLIAWDFRRANRRLFPTTGTTRWSTVTTILLSPPAALHATKYLARDIGNGYHPLALAAARCSNKDFRALASWILREVMFVPETGVNLDSQGADCTRWFSRRFCEAVSALVRKKGQDPEELVAPPLRQSESVQSYCPRCLSQFVIPDGVCTDCGRVSLRPFDLPS